MKRIQTKRIKVIFDTNIWISFTLGKKLSSLQKIISLPQFYCIISDEILTEYLLVIQRKKFTKYVTQRNIEDTLLLMQYVCKKHKITTQVFLSRDRNDNFLLSLSKEVNADFLITGDEDLLILNYFENTRICKFSEFEKLFQ